MFPIKIDDFVLKKLELSLSKEYQGSGIVTKACLFLLQYGFESLKLNTITISCAVENIKSRAIPEKLGFELKEIIKNKEWLYDHYVDHALYSMSLDCWLKIKKI